MGPGWLCCRNLTWQFSLILILWKGPRPKNRLYSVRTVMLMSTLHAVRDPEYKPSMYFKINISILPPLSFFVCKSTAAYLSQYAN